MGLRNLMMRSISLFLGENESLTISPEAIKQIKEHTDKSNRLIKELQEQLRIVPQLQVC